MALKHAHFKLYSRLFKSSSSKLYFRAYVRQWIDWNCMRVKMIWQAIGDNLKTTFVMCLKHTASIFRYFFITLPLAISAKMINFLYLLMWCILWSVNFILNQAQSGTTLDAAVLVLSMNLHFGTAMTRNCFDCGSPSCFCWWHYYVLYWDSWRIYWNKIS